MNCPSCNCAETHQPYAMATNLFECNACGSQWSIPPRTDAEIIEWMCRNASKMGMKPEWSWISNKGGAEWTDIRGKVSKLMAEAQA